MNCKSKFQIASFLLLVITLFWIMPLRVQAADSGVIDNMKWEYDSGVLTISGEGVLLPNDKWKSDDIKIIVVEGFSEIADSAFAMCKNLEEIEISEGLTTIGSDAFSGCEKLSKVILPDSLMNIGGTYSDLYGFTQTEGVFSDCPLLKTAGPEGGNYNIEFCWKNEIPKYAFNGIDALVSIVIPDGVKRVNENTFNNCASLASVTIPKSLVDFGIFKLPNYDDYYCGKRAFVDCPLLKTAGPIGGDYNIKFAWTDTIPMSAFDNCISLISATIPSGITTIEMAAFQGCENLQKIELNDGLKDIQPYAFYTCNQLKEIIIPAGVEAIGQYAFIYCKNLEKVILPDSVKTMGYARIASDTAQYSVFEGCDKLLSAGPIGGNYDLQFGWNKTIPRYAFHMMDFLQSIDIPEGVETIEREALSQCWALTYVTLPNSLKTIGESAFYYDISIKEMNIHEGVETIEGYAFCYCRNIEKMTLPQSLKQVGSVCIDKGGKEYPIGCFGETEKLCTAGPIGGNYNIEYAWTKELPARAFAGFTYLVSVDIADGITDIGNDVFGYNSKLQKVSFPKSVVNIGRNFENCEAMTQIEVYNVTALANLKERQANGEFSGITIIGHECVHDEVELRIIPATSKTDGEVVTICKSCGAEIGRDKINKAYVIVDETAKYTGKAIKQPVSIVDCNGKKISKEFYSIAYKNNKKAGAKASAIITFKGNYAGTVTKSFTIVKKTDIPSKVTGLKLTAGKKFFTVSWKKATKNVTGYEIQYSEDKNFVTGVKVVNISKASTSSKKVSKLTKGKTYYVRVRAYNKSGKNKAYSGWSSAKKVKVK